MSLPRHFDAKERAPLPKPVERALRRLGTDISTARRMRRLSQEDLAQRMGTSVSSVRRLEDGNPGTALHTVLRALQVLGRLDALAQVTALDTDVLGMELVQQQLPQRVRSSRAISSRSNRQTGAQRDTVDDSDELEGF